MIAFDETGRGEPLVLLHGLGANRTVWARVTPSLATDRLVLAADLPGFGNSPPAARGFKLTEVADALAETVAERAGGPFDLVGNSLGGAVALQLASRRPELVRSLILAAPAGFAPAPSLVAEAAGRLLPTAMTLRRRLGIPLAGIPAVRQVLLFGAVADPAELNANDALLMLRGSRGSTRIGAALSAVLRADLRSMLSDVDLPLGLLWGSRDRVVPLATLDWLRAARPDAHVQVLAGAAHVPQLERPDEFVAALRRLLRRLTTQPNRHKSVRFRG